MNLYTLKISEILKKIENTIILRFKQPALRKIKYKSGQYITLIFRINGRRYSRPYSFSSAPDTDPFIEIAIKRIEGGIVSNHIYDQVKVGDSIEVMEPMGDFVLEPSETGISSVCLWGAGSGITPLISIIKTLLYKYQDYRVTLIYGNRKRESVMFYDLISDLLIKFPDRFKVWHFYTLLAISENNPYVIEGRISTEYALNILRVIGVENTDHYICGPAGLKESVKKALQVLNVPVTNIFSEDFELVKDPRDFEEIHTRDINIKFQGKEHSLEIVKGKSILEAALDAGLELPYSCQTGNCSTCKAYRINGELVMIGLTKQRTDLEQNEFLLCCSHPLTDDVFVEI